MLEKARALGVRRFCVHKGLPLGPVEDYNHPRDLIRAATDFPDIDFPRVPLRAPQCRGDHPGRGRPWTTEFCQMKQQAPGLTNIYMELGSTFGQLVTNQSDRLRPPARQVIGAFGADHVLWGTGLYLVRDTAVADRRVPALRDAEALIEKHGYTPLTRAVKEQIFGLNAARVFGVDAHATRHELPRTISAGSR